MVTKRDTPKKMMLEILPTKFLCFIFILFMLVLIASILLIVVAPPPYTTPSIIQQLTWNQTKGMNPIVVAPRVSYPLYSLNKEIKLSCLFEISDRVDGLEKTDLNLDVSIYGYNYYYKYPRLLLSKSVNHQSLYCDEQNSTCKPIVLFRERVIRYKYYEVSLIMNGIGNVFEDKILKRTIKVDFRVGKAGYTIFETVVRFLFTLFSCSMFIFYLILLLCMQKCRFMKTEQVWMIFVLFFLILFNNPLYFLDWLISSVPFLGIFSTLNIFFISTFANFLILFVMIIIHSFIIPPKQRKFCSFYFIKILVVSCNWLLMSLLQFWERWNQSFDLSYDISMMPGNDITKIGGTVFSVACLLMICYFIFRVLGESFENKISYNYSKRFKVFGVFTLLVAVVAGIDYLSTIFMVKVESAAQFISFFPLFNYYCFVLAVLFLPSPVREDDPRESVLPKNFFSQKKKPDYIDIDDNLSDFDDDTELQDSQIEKRKLISKSQKDGKKEKAFSLM